jgi:hypothetical protein
MKAERDLTDLVTRLKNDAGNNLLSVILYGSAATEEFHAGHSDLNMRHPADSRKTLELMTSSISAFAALFRHALIALGDNPPPTKRGAVDRLGSILGFDPSPFHTIFEIREGHKRERDVNVQATFEAYLDGVVKVTEEMDRRLVTPPANE